ncbi:MAG: hypothetical protein WD080_10960 [Egibacteraceae bacterium]
MRRQRTQTRPVFYPDRLAMILGAGHERLAAMESDAESVDLLTWNIFASLATHADQDWLAYRLQALGGTAVRAPLRISLWTGRDREPFLRPSPEYTTAIKQRSAAAGHADDALSAFEQAIDLPVRVESPDTLLLVDPIGTQYRRGGGGRDRLLELIDAGLTHARRLSRALTIAVVYPSGTPAAGDLSARINELRDPATLRAELAHRRTIPPLALRELSWQRLIHLWDAEREHLDLSGQPVKAFLAHLEGRGLR